MHYTNQLNYNTHRKTQKIKITVSYILHDSPFDQSRSISISMPLFVTYC